MSAHERHHDRLAPPMANGELVFDAPWQGRVFGIARALSEQGIYGWDEFREELIAAIERWERARDPSAEYRYYDRLLEALEALLLARGLLEGTRLTERTAHLHARPHGHDHPHRG